MGYVSIATVEMFQRPAHFENLVANTEEVRGLLGIHRTLTGDRVGRRHRVEILNKSAVVLLVACWESFAEDLAVSAFDFLLSKAETPDMFPSSVLAVATRKLKESRDDRDIWKLAGNGWREVLVQHRDAVSERFAGRLNTPKPDQIDQPLDDMIGLQKLSQHWRWKGATSARNRERLEALVALRGEIAHRVRATASVRKKYASDSSHFVYTLAAKSSNAVAEFLRKRTGWYPWQRVVYGGTS